MVVAPNLLLQLSDVPLLDVDSLGFEPPLPTPPQRIRAGRRTSGWKSKNHEGSKHVSFDSHNDLTLRMVLLQVRARLARLFQWEFPVYLRLERAFVDELRQILERRGVDLPQCIIVGNTNQQYGQVDGLC